MSLSSYLSPTRLLEGYLRRCLTSAGLTSQTLSIDSETTIHFWGPPPLDHRSDDDERPVMLLLHGFGPSSMWQWRRQIQAFSPSVFRLYSPDLVFFGDSTSSSTNRTEVFQAECMAKLMEKIGVEKYNVVGTSYGGFVAYHMAKMWPEKVEKVVIASSGINMRKCDSESLLQRSNCECIEKVMLPSTATELRTLMALASSWRLVRMFPDALWNDVINNLYKKNRKEKIELLKGVTFGRNENLNIDPLSQEVLIVWGDKDQIFPVKMAYELKEILGEKAKLEIIDNTSHVPQIECAQEFNNIVLKFLKGS
ncbi:Alpha/Beta hydrolase fold [Arabidopsis suecica]|uniref:Alpha/Beta hydrolase fold n=1 Tax=Arabidopsis suecica TaxID=45249 RepID=A0A8T1YGW3_ARASU|nr:Alpha/Beta hydrolase fold [Arabidopsis suecica]